MTNGSTGRTPPQMVFSDFALRCGCGEQTLYELATEGRYSCPAGHLIDVCLINYKGSVRLALNGAYIS